MSVGKLQLPAPTTFSTHDTADGAYAAVKIIGYFEFRYT